MTSADVGFPGSPITSLELARPSQTGFPGLMATFEKIRSRPNGSNIAFAKLQPADVIFFGDRGPRSKPAQVGHMGIYVGNGWFIHSSDYGVALAQLTGWYRREFAWARRPLREAGLTG